MYFIGIDISSTSTKVAMLDNQDNFCDLFLLSSSFSAIKIVHDIKEILEQKGYQYASIVATEYGRASVEYANIGASEILCQGFEAHHLFKPDCIVIDVGR